MTNEELSKGECKVAFLGTNQKSTTFRSLCQNVLRYEKHANYQDVHYLTVQQGTLQMVLEFTDPGLARTGAREMAIRHADIVLLIYSSHSSSSLKALYKLSEAFDVRPQLRILLVCDTADSFEEESDATNLSSSLSEGYESDHEPIKRYRSMEQMRKSLDEDLYASDYKNNLLNAFADRCTFIEINSASRQDMEDLVQDIIVNLQMTHSIGKRRKSAIKGLLRSKSNEKDSSPVSRQGSEKQRKGNKKENVDSKVCIVM